MAQGWRAGNAGRATGCTAPLVRQIVRLRPPHKLTGAITFSTAISCRNWSRFRAGFAGDAGRYLLPANIRRARNATVTATCSGSRRRRMTTVNNQANAVCVRCGIFRPRCRWIAMKTKESDALDKNGYACVACRKKMKGRFYYSCRIPGAKTGGEAT